MSIIYVSGNIYVSQYMYQSMCVCVSIIYVSVNVCVSVTYISLFLFLFLFIYILETITNDIGHVKYGVLLTTYHINTWYTYYNTSYSVVFYFLQSFHFLSTNTICLYCNTSWLGPCGLRATSL